MSIDQSECLSGTTQAARIEIGAFRLTRWRLHDVPELTEKGALNLDNYRCHTRLSEQRRV